MPTFLDAHSMSNITEDELKKLQHSEKDEFGILHINILYNTKENRCFCLLDAPNKEAVEAHHKKAGIRCEWILEVQTTA